jgi:hypothetical protein
LEKEVNDLDRERMKLKEKLKSMLAKIGFEMDEDFLRDFANI